MSVEQVGIADASAGEESALFASEIEPSGWRVAAASVVGVSHEKTGQVCQDAHCWRTMPGVLVAAVADGAGSAALGEHGAILAAQTVVETLVAQAESGWPQTEAEWRTLLRAAFEFTRTAVENEATARDAAVRDLATTLIALVATPTWIAVGQIGDGAVVCDHGDGLIALSNPPSDEYINQTTFLTTPDALDTLHVTLLQGAIASLAAFSDGLQRLALKMPDGTPHPPFFAPLFRFVAAEQAPEQAGAQLAAFLRSPKITERADDDLTLLLATPIL